MRAEANSASNCVTRSGCARWQRARLPNPVRRHLISGADLLAVQVGSYCWATDMTIEAVIRRRLIERIDTLPVEVMDSVDAARRAALEL